ncbi:hypothetical protein GCM10023258_11210 [Terrabacter aeriphilus]|uniref:Uncharacterized protein n=1 Tax=Terrabacter aeriphilus TaxID=515662 RepID=A0ABP9J8T9_9MICO
MPVSSLIFVVIVAIWAAYLVQHWVRRREEAAATRSVDGFTEAMRVLEKRPLLPSTELRPPRPHSYAVQPARTARPTVDVKRAVPAGSSRRSSPLVARRPEPVAAGHAPHAEVDRMPSTTPRAQRQERPGATRPGARAARRVSLAQRRLRAALLLASLAWVPVSLVLAVTGVLLWVSVPFALVTVGAVLFWLRAEAQADRRRAADAGRGQRARGRHVDEDAHEHAAADWELEPSIDATQVIRSAVAAAPTAAAPERREPAAGVFDVQAAMTGEVPVAAPAAVEDDAAVREGSWSPVPVPRPTYTMKAKAEPRWTDSGIPADVFDTPEFADEAEELDDRALFARRAVSQ